MYQLYSFEILNNQHGLRLPKHQVGRNVSDLEICATIGDVIANIELHASTSAYVLAWHPSILLPAPFQEQVDQDDLRKGKPISRSLSNSEPRTGRYYLWTAALGATIFNLVHDAIPATHPTCIYIYIYSFLPVAQCPQIDKQQRVTPGVPGVISNCCLVKHPTRRPVVQCPQIEKTTNSQIVAITLSAPFGL